MSIEQLKTEVGRLTKDYPKAKLPLPMMLSKRPTFRG
jgi:hypothetical protein